MGVIDGNCRVEIYIHLLDLLNQEQKQPRPQAPTQTHGTANQSAWGRGWNRSNDANLGPWQELIPARFNSCHGSKVAFFTSGSIINVRL